MNTNIAQKIILGTANFGSKISTNESSKIIEKAYLLGINKIDTADSYENSEEIIGDIIKSAREKFFISTKVGNPTKLGAGLSNDHIRRSLDESLKRLRTDYIDTYYVHNFDFSTDIRTSLETLDQLFNKKYFKYLGCSNYNLHQLIFANSILSEISSLKISYSQPVFNIIEYSYIYDFLKYTKEKKIITCGYSPLAGGILTGKYINGIPLDSRAAEFEDFDQKTSGFIPKLNWLSISTAKKIQEIAFNYNLTASQLSLGWALNNNLIDHIIIGVSSLENFNNFADVEVPLEAINEINFNFGLRRS